MEKSLGDFLEFLGFLVLFFFLLLRNLKKKPTVDEPKSVEEEQGVLQEKSSFSEIKEPSFQTVASERSTRGRIPPVAQPKALLSPRKVHGRQLVLSYEILSKPLSLRVPRI
jgi:hypothetical protein